MYLFYTLIMQIVDILIFLLIVIVVLYYCKNIDTRAYHEGFTQKEPFSLKENNEIYDNFYTSVYNDLFKSNSRSQFEYEQIINVTQPSNSSVILDVGSGTGHLMNKFDKEGYNIHGLEKSKSMIQQSITKFPKLTIHEGDTLDPMVFENGTFTHICCMDFTVYHINNKRKFIRNCYNWLLPNGYLILHLVNKNKYDTTVPSANSSEYNPQELSKERIKKTHIDFIDFDYLHKVDFKNDNRVIIKETFTDSLTKNVRQNENTLIMESIEEIISLIRNNGFIVHAKAIMPKDKEQFIYIFEKQL